MAAKNCILCLFPPIFCFMTVRPFWGVRGYYCYKTNIGWGRGGHGICFAHHLLPLNPGAVALFKKKTFDHWRPLIKLVKNNHVLKVACLACYLIIICSISVLGQVQDVCRICPPCHSHPVLCVPVLMFLPL